MIITQLCSPCHLITVDAATKLLLSPLVTQATGLLCSAAPLVPRLHRCCLDPPPHSPGRHRKSQLGFEPSTAQSSLTVVICPTKPTAQTPSQARTRIHCHSPAMAALRFIPAPPLVASIHDHGDHHLRPWHLSALTGDATAPLPSIHVAANHSTVAISLATPPCHLITVDAATKLLLSPLVTQATGLLCSAAPLVPRLHRCCLDPPPHSPGRHRKSQLGFEPSTAQSSLTVVICPTKPTAQTPSQARTRIHCHSPAMAALRFIPAPPLVASIHDHGDHHLRPWHLSALTGDATAPLPSIHVAANHSTVAISLATPSIPQVCRALSSAINHCRRSPC
ncbi:hypothetical protein M0R45_008341 [Rubus argutus]|uniref:Uncharacterized protein n=1 Tax=Rubus argutus TaxID=59490 RepID=A0AAW1Y467_RUBAR